MHRLSEFEHDVVADIDKRINTSQPRPSKSFPHAIRSTLPWPDIRNRSSNIAGAMSVTVERDRARFIFCSADPRQFGLPQRAACQGGNLTGNPEHTEAVSAIWRQFHLKKPIWQLQMVI